MSPDLADKDSIREGVKAAKPYMTANICIGTHCHLLWASNHEAGCQLLHTYLLGFDPDMFRTYSTYLDSKGIFLKTAKNTSRLACTTDIGTLPTIDEIL